MSFANRRAQADATPGVTRSLCETRSPALDGPAAGPPVSPAFLFRARCGARQAWSSTLIGWDGASNCSSPSRHAPRRAFWDGRDARIFTVDAVGEWTTTSTDAAMAAGVELFEEVGFPQSLDVLQRHHAYPTRRHRRRVQIMGSHRTGGPEYFVRCGLVEHSPAQFRLALRTSFRAGRACLRGTLHVSPQAAETESGSMIYEDVARIPRWCRGDPAVENRRGFMSSGLPAVCAWPAAGRSQWWPTDAS